ncbi:ATPase, T2SS/T4P/T4SS family [Spirillospora sp. CA-142024]|uniref:ATPase, T2SS/T4P/T4SS family n=1 Tax=Spirillospora sp. CA-142024 TaxID=3240036 RepID=UPI003D92D1A2
MDDVRALLASSSLGSPAVSRLRSRAPSAEVEAALLRAFVEQVPEKRAMHTLAHWRERLREAVDLEELQDLPPARRRVRLEDLAGRLISAEGALLSSAERASFIRRLVDQMLGLGVLEPLLADASVTDIFVNGPERIYAERDGRLQLTNLSFDSEQALYETIERIISVVDLPFGRSDPVVDTRLPTGERITIVGPPLSPLAPVLAIRRFRRFPRLDQIGDQPTADLLFRFVLAKLTFLVSGTPSVDKESLLNTLMTVLPDGERVITFGMGAPMTHLIMLEGSHHTLHQLHAHSSLLQAMLALRPDRVVLGEILPTAALDAMHVLLSGPEGTMLAVNAPSGPDALHRLALLGALGESSPALDTLLQAVWQAVEIVVHIKRDADGSLRIDTVQSVDPANRELQVIVEYVQGGYRHHPLNDRVTDRLRGSGLEIPPEFLA